MLHVHRSCFGRSVALAHVCEAAASALAAPHKNNWPASTQIWATSNGVRFMVWCRYADILLDRWMYAVRRPRLLMSLRMGH